MKRFNTQLFAFFSLILSIVSITGCDEKPSQDESMRKELAYLRHTVDSLKSIAPNATDTSAQFQVDTALKAEAITTVPQEVKEKTENPIPFVPEKKKEEKKLPEKNEVVVAGEERFYYTSSKKLSLLITPWKEDKRELIFYDPFGNIQYTQEDVRHSYSNISEVKSFHPNGAVAKISVHNNPGASMYWSESEITFGINNDPEWMVVMTYPVHNLEQNLNNHYYWDKKTGNWVKQIAMD
ncbi:MAG: hypothetical protein ACKVOK_03970 [Flavobacteriales bacterium]